MELLVFLSAVLAAGAGLLRGGVGGWWACGVRSGTFRVQWQLPAHTDAGLSPSGSAGIPGREQGRVCVLRGLLGTGRCSSVGGGAATCVARGRGWVAPACSRSL